MHEFSLAIHSRVWVVVAEPIQEGTYDNYYSKRYTCDPHIRCLVQSAFRDSNGIV